MLYYSIYLIPVFWIILYLKDCVLYFFIWYNLKYCIIHYDIIHCTMLYWSLTTDIVIYFSDSKVENESIIPSEGITSQILITTVADTHSLMTPSADSTTVRIAPRDYTGTESTLANITVSGKDDVSRADSNPDSGGDSSMIIVTDVGHEQDDGDVTDRYLIKESDVKEKISLKSIDSAEWINVLTVSISKVRGRVRKKSVRCVQIVSVDCQN